MDRAELPARWAAAVSRITYVPLDRAAVEREFAALVARLAAQPAEVGRGIVTLGFRHPDCLGTTIGLLAELPGVDGHVLGELAAGFAEAARTQLFSEQENLHAALHRAKDNAVRSLAASEARFTELFDTSALGMLVTDPGGGVARANEAIEEILGHPRGTLFRKRFEDLLHPEDRTYLRGRYAELATSGGELRERTRMLRADGDVVWTRIAVSLLRDADGLPDHHVTMVEDISDLHLLEHRITYQGTHDMLTGLPNRSAFTSRLEEAIGAGADFAVVHLALEDFAVVNDGLGRHAGDRLLTSVASRVVELVEDTDAVVARLGDHEFAILLRPADAGPRIAAQVNDALAEPTYVDGTGIAVSASVAVAVRPAAGTPPVELLRATDITIRELRARGRRQWGLVDAAEVARRSSRWSLAAALPGAWENGELDVDLEPVCGLADGVRTSERAVLRWNSPTRGLIPAGMCADLLAETGMGVSVGRWMLSRAAERVGSKGRLYVELTADLAADADLVAVVRAVCASSGVELSRLDLGMPVGAAAVPDGPVADNVVVLADLGVRVVLTEFGRGAGELGCVADLPVHAVRVDDGVARRVAEEVGGGGMVVEAVRVVVPLVRGRGVSVIVPGVGDWVVAGWWGSAGADLGMGELFGE
ncbi:diguanylate cyclase domain-containing protein [Actinokineospora guangxiensis]|uniref:Diguanylate cyclase domain-containing protein n=1 Tax=Actinokineospora guangxiensis TaxID=1490288 RepID=A0ABW0ER02_9PSEU